MGKDMLDPRELIIDNFAGGGGASLGIELALGRSPDVAINHDREAVAMHTANHPDTEHYCEDVWQVDPRAATQGRPVGLAWFSPDCKHFSKAKGGKPVSKKIRGLAWVVIRWAAAVKPRVIILENVEEFQTWGPLLEDGRPCPVRKGRTFRRWWKRLEKFGYHVEMRELRACDYGAPTIRKRLFIIARCDGQPIIWPAPTHGPGRLPYHTAAGCIDWSIPCPSIFGRKKPLADATLRRIAQGVKRYVVEAAHPFIVGADQAPFFVPRHGEREGQEPRCRSVVAPLPTVTATANGASLVAAFLAQHNTGMVGHDARKPVSTIVGKGCTQALVASNLVKLYGTCKDGQDNREPMATVTSGGQHLGEVRAFLTKFYGNEKDGISLGEPLHTVTTKDRFGLVTVSGIDYVIADIGMRMLAPRELYRAQGFPDSYIIDPMVNGRRLPKASQVRMCGNSVCPPIARALVAANFGAEVGAVEVAA